MKYAFIQRNKLVQRLMQKHGIKARGKRRFRVVTTDSKHNFPIAPNVLDRKFTVAAPTRMPCDQSLGSKRSQGLKDGQLVDLGLPAAGWHRGITRPSDEAVDGGQGNYHPLFRLP
jgi:hypothetical protein